MILNCDGELLKEELANGTLDADDLIAAFGHIANAIESAGLNPYDYL